MTAEPLLTQPSVNDSNFSRPSTEIIKIRGSANKQLLEALQEVNGIDSVSKKALLYRISGILYEYTNRAFFYSIVYHFGRGTVTIGSLIVPALLSIQGPNSPTASYSTELYWLTWSLSLFVTIFNGILTLFKIEKKYNYLNTLQEQVRSEGWQYVHLTGKYGGHHFAPDKSTHIKELIHFTHSLERIKLNQTNEEYWKTQESEVKKPNSDKKSLEALYTPTPTTQQLLEVITESESSQGSQDTEEKTPIK